MLKQNKKCSSKSNSCLLKRGNGRAMFYWKARDKRCKYKKESTKNRTEKNINKSCCWCISLSRKKKKGVLSNKSYELLSRKWVVKRSKLYHPKQYQYL